MRFFPLLAALVLVGLSTPAHALDFGAFFASHLGAGSAGRDGDDFYRKRSVGSIDLQAMPGLHVYGKSILAGMLFDFRMLSELENADPTNHGDFGGFGLLIGPAVLFDFTFGKVLLSWDIRDRQSISSPDAALKGSGFHILFGYKASSILTVDLEYVHARYNAIYRSDLDIETGLDERSLSQNNLSIGVSVSL